MLEQLRSYLKPPVFPGDDDQTFTAGLLHVILWSLLVGICLYTFTASVFAIIQPHMLLIAWLYVIAMGVLAVSLMVIMRRGYVRFAAITVNVGFWIILTVAAYSNGGVAAPAYSGYLIVIICACLLVGWQWGLAAAIVSALAGLFFLRAPLPDWLPTYSFQAVWAANVAYFFIAAMLVALALRAIKHAMQQTRLEIVERQKTEQALSHSEQRFHAIFDAVNDAIFVQDLSDGRILDVNQKMCEMYGYTVEEARELPVGDLSSGGAPYTQQEALAWMQKAAGGEPQIFEWQAKDRTGRWFWVEVNMRRAAIDGQDRLLVVVRDIDDRKRAEAKQRHEQAYYEAIVNATPVMLWLKDAKNRLLRLNPAAAKLEGVEAAEVEGKSAYELYPREQAEAYYQDDLEVIQSGQPKLGIIEQHTAAGSGKMMWVETGKVPVRDEQGNIAGVLACAVDITARKEAEQVQAATRQIAEAALMTPTLEEFYQAVYTIIAPLIPANNFFITLYDAGSDQLTVPYLVDEFDTAWLPYRPGKGLSAYVMRSGEPLLATPEVFAELERQGQAEILVRRMVEWLGVPLKTPHGLLGVMAVQNYSGPARLSEKHKDLLVFVSAQVAMAIERKRAEERERRMSQGLRAVIEAAQELIDCTDLDSLYRRSVELARERLGLERCSLYLLDDRQENIVGTYGTDADGQTTDERSVSFPAGGLIDVFGRTDRPWWSDETELSYWQAGSRKPVGRGWVASTPLHSSRRVIGVLYNDTAMSHAPLDATQQDIAAVYCSLLSGLIELKRAEAALAHERDLLQALMDNFPDTIYFKDTVSRFTRINRAQARLLGITQPDEAIGKTDANFFRDSELVQLFVAEEQQLMSRGEPIIDRVEYNPAPDGQPRWLSASKIPLRDASGAIVGMVGISRDITDRMLAEQREKTISQGLRTVIEAAQELIDCTDLDTLYRRSVELAREKLGLERCGLFLLNDEGQYLIGTYGTDEHGHTTDERQARDPISSAQRSELFAPRDRWWTSFSGPQRHWDGGTLQYLPGAGWIVATLIRSRQRTLGVMYNDTALTHAPLDETRQDIVAVYCSLLGSLIDLKRTEVQLAHERDLLQSLMDNIPDAIYFKDTASRFTHINQAMVRILGLRAPHEAAGKTDADFFSTEMDQIYVAEEQQLLHTGQPLLDRVEYNPTPEGRPRWFSASKVPLCDGSGQIVGMVGISRDITDRMLAEQREKTISLGLRAVIEATQELIDCADLDTLYRRSVELAREKLKVERCGLFTLDERGWLHGTYGTDMQHQTTDERRAQFQPINVTGLNAESDLLWTITESEHSFWEGDQHRGSGAGWVGGTFIRTRDRVTGVLYNDTAITHAPVDEAQQEVLAVYCSLLGSLIELKHAEAALRESESTMRALLDAVPDAIFRLDAQGVFKDYIPAKDFAPWLPPSEFIGQTFTQVLPPELTQQLTETLQSVLEKGELRLYEYMLSAEGHSRYFEARLVKMAQGDVLGIVRDVTDRKQAELALQQREAYLRSIFDNFPYWVWLKDATSRFLAVNQTMAQAFGFEQAHAMIGKTDWEITAPELAEKYRADDLAVMESRTQKFLEEIVEDQGEEKWFETFKSPIFDAQGQVIGTTGFAHDITARRQAEAAIRESEALFRQLADNAPALIALSDETGRVTYLNRAWQDFRGDVPAMPLEDWAEHIHPDDRRRYTHEYRSALQGQRKFTTECRIRRADGQYRWLLDTAVPRYAANERFIGFIGIAIDITDRKNAEEALRRSEGRLRLITDNMADSISQVDAQQRVVYASPSAERIFGHSLRDQLGRSLYDLVHPEDSSRLYHQVVMAIELRVPSLRLEYRYRHAAGHYLWVESEMRLLYGERGSFTGAVFGSRDISTRKQIEGDREDLIKELEGKNAELERFTYTVSHDLKSPLITIRGFLGFLEKDAATGNLDRLRADIARIAEATTRMQRLLDELLDLSRIGRMINPPEEVGFGQIAHEAVELVRGRIMARGVQVKIADDLPAVYVDRTRLVEAVQNLVDNAVKFMGDQAEPRIVIGALGAERAGLPIFFVEDNGLGIEPEYHERIFGLFNKLDAKSEGTGVGLALVKRIIDLHGGHVWVESDGSGQGSTFFFTLPPGAQPKLDGAQQR